MSLLSTSTLTKNTHALCIFSILRFIFFKVCKRTFLEDRIAKHAEVCHKTTAKQRPVYDVVGARVGGTDAGELVAAGKIKLEPAKPMAKKSELMKKYNTTGTESTFHSQCH